jgi:hypothetical protein
MKHVIIWYFFILITLTGATYHWSGVHPET